MRIVSVLSIIFLMSGVSHAHAMCTGCDVDHFKSQLAKSEGATDNCVGGGGHYTCLGPELDETSSHHGDRPMGLYQMMPNTAIKNGCISSNSSSEVQRFLNDSNLQEACMEKEMQSIFRYMDNNGIGSGAADYDCGALVAAGWLGGPGATTDLAAGKSKADRANTSYTTADRASSFNGVCAGGELSSPYYNRGSQTLIGCAEEVLENAKAISDGALQVDFEKVAQLTPKPNNISQTTCEDQHANNIEKITGKFSAQREGAGDMIKKHLKEPQAKFVEQTLNSASNLVGSVTSSVNSAFTSLSGGLSGGGSSSSDCGLLDMSWQLGQCDMSVALPNVKDIIGGKVQQIKDGVNTLTGLLHPDRLAQQICKVANNTLGDLMGKANDAVDGAVDAMANPFTDRVDTIGNNIEDVTTIGSQSLIQ